MGTMGLRPGVFWALLAGASEFGGGLLLALGLLNPLGALGVIAAMATAISLMHWPRFWASDNGLEFALVNASAALGIAIAGPGIYSLDAASGISLPQPASLLLGLSAVALGVLIASVLAGTARLQQAAEGPDIEEAVPPAA